MRGKKRVLLKITGNAFHDSTTGTFCSKLIRNIAQQIKRLANTHQFSIVVGGGNIFRGSQYNDKLGISPSTGHHIGMLATVINGTLITDVIQQQGLAATHLCALPGPPCGKTPSLATIKQAQSENHVLIFTGGTGNTFFTTDTGALVRALQVEAAVLWKGSNVDGIYTADPQKTSAEKISRVTYQDAWQQKLGILDLTAYALGQQYNIPIRVFNIFSSNALLNAAQDETFGSTIIQ